MQSDSFAVPSIGEPTLHVSSILSAASPDPSPDSSAVVSEDDGRGRSERKLSRPRLGSRKSSGTMIVSRDAPTTVVDDEFEEDDVRAMSPRRSSQEVDRLGEAARKDLVEQAKELQTSLQAIIDRVETVKSEHEKLEGGNKFLQSYVSTIHSSACASLTSPQIHRRAHANVEDHILRAAQIQRQAHWKVNHTYAAPHSAVVPA